MQNQDQHEQLKKRSEVDDKPEGRSIAHKVEPISKVDSDRLMQQFKKELDPALGFPTPKLEVATTSAPETKLKKDWVVSLDITVHLGTDTAKSQKDRLQLLADSTKGKSVALVVQDVEAGAKGKQAELHRYMIADGASKQLDTEEAKGFAADAASLVKKANELVDGKNTAFIEMGHGNGNSGFMGDDGPAEVKELADALLAANGRPLNDIVLDSCLVAQDGAIKALAGAAKDDVVASAELGGDADDSVRGLNYEKTLAHLIKDPSMDGKALAKKFVEDGKDGANIYPNSNGVPTPGIRDLTAFDPLKVASFEEKLGKFGDALKDAEGTPGNRGPLQKLISKAFKYDIAHADDQKRDLSAFAKSVQDAIQKGLLKDPTQQLAHSTEQILAAQKDMTDATYGEGKFAGLGGLSVFLPSSDHTHQRDGKTPNLMDMVQSFVGKAVDGKRTDDATKSTLHTQVRLLAEAISDRPELTNDMNKLKKIAESIDGASTDEDKRASTLAFRQTLKELSEDKAFMKAMTQCMPGGERYDLSLSGNAGWSNFVKSLYSDEMFAA